MKRYFVYILTNAHQTIYVGVTSNLMQRIQQHRNHTFTGFTAKYNISTLVHYEEFGDVRDAIEREKQIKNYSRARKIDLIEAENPKWDDLAADWF